MDAINVLSAEQLSKSYGTKVLFKNLTFGLSQGEKVALVARNGTGKTSLMRIMAGQDTSDTGRVTYRKGLKVKYLSQDPDFDPNQTVLQVLLQSDNPALQAVREYEESLANPDSHDRLNRAMQEMERLQAWDAEVKAKQFLSQLKLEDIHQKTATLSGGQKKRLALAHVLMEEPDLLLLDEPTNHLDMDMIEWLEGYLAQGNLTLFMVTHDRYFLENVCNVILELDDNQLFKYEGNYSYFLEKRAERQQNINARAAKAQNLYRRELDWIRSTPQARTGKSKSRIDNFENVKAQARTRKQDDKVELDIRMERLGGKILEIHKLRKELGGKMLIDRFDYVFKTGDRIGIVGPNGVGKSTFLKLITGRLEPDGGKIITGETVKFGYYTQGGLEGKDHLRVIEVIKEIAEYIPVGKGQNLSAAQLLERFLFEGEDQYTYVEKLSGGEKRRLYLCTVLMANPNFLILDEPTNDLDILTLNVLEDFLQEFQGVLVVVSHDRYFIDKLCNHLFVFEGAGSIKDFNGTYSEYRLDKHFREQKQAEVRSYYREKQRKQDTDNKVKDQKHKRSYKEEREFEQLSKEIEEMESRKLEIETFFESGSTDADKVMEMSQEMERLQNQLNEKELRWLELSELDPN